MEENEVIDLTQSFTFCRAPTRAPIILNCEVIDLDDFMYASPRPVAAPAEPIYIENETEATGLTVNARKRQSKKSTGIKKRKRSSNSAPALRTPQEPEPYYGDCPICRDRLGTRPMASTKCGHVYCISCIDQAVKIEKKCPTCRKPLKGATAYHPLFL